MFGFGKKPKHNSLSYGDLVDEVVRLQAWLMMIEQAGPADDADPKDAWASAALKGWSVEDFGKGKIDFQNLTEKP